MLQFSQGLKEESSGDILVINSKGKAIFVQRVKDRLLRKPMDKVFAHIACRSMRGCRMDIEPVRLS